MVMVKLSATFGSVCPNFYGKKYIGIGTTSTIPTKKVHIFRQNRNLKYIWRALSSGDIIYGN